MGCACFDIQSLRADLDVIAFGRTIFTNLPERIYDGNLTELSSEADEAEAKCPADFEKFMAVLAETYRVPEDMLEDADVFFLPEEKGGKVASISAKAVYRYGMLRWLYPWLLKFKNVTGGLPESKRVLNHTP